jgi:putative heme-binding domain-containing protein
LILDAWAELQGDTGQLLLWKATLGPLSLLRGEQLAKEWSQRGVNVKWKWSEQGMGLEGRFKLSKNAAPGMSTWPAATLFEVRKAEPLEFMCKSDGKYRVWLDGKEIFNKAVAGNLNGAADRFVVKTAKGRHWISVAIDSAKTPSFQMRFRWLSEVADQEALTQHALTTRGNTRRGKDLFFNQQKSLCIRCHRMDAQGGTVGPDLTGVGGRFSRIHLIESILQPSRHIANGYGMVVVVLQNDEAIAGVKREETPKTLTLGLVDGKFMTLRKDQIKQITPTTASLMPAGLEKLWTRQEFVDLIEYLAGQKK